MGIFETANSNSAFFGASLVASIERAARGYAFLPVIADGVAVCGVAFLLPVVAKARSGVIQHAALVDREAVDGILGAAATRDVDSFPPLFFDVQGAVILGSHACGDMYASVAHIGIAVEWFTRPVNEDAVVECQFS